MTEAKAPNLTALLQAWEQGDRASFGQLIQHAQGELRRIALSRLRGSQTPSLATGDLMHEALLKLMDAPSEWKDRAHFFATVSMTMRSVLVDHARARQADKRGGAWRRLGYTLSDIGEESNIVDLLTLDQLLNQLERVDPRAAQVLQLTYFGGLQRQAIADVLALSLPTIDRELRFARAWLSSRLQRELEA